MNPVATVIIVGMSLMALGAQGTVQERCREVERLEREALRAWVDAHCCDGSVCEDTENAAEGYGGEQKSLRLGRLGWPALQHLKGVKGSFWHAVWRSHGRDTYELVVVQAPCSIAIANQPDEALRLVQTSLKEGDSAGLVDIGLFLFGVDNLARVAGRIDAENRDSGKDLVQGEWDYGCRVVRGMQREQLHATGAGRDFEREILRAPEALRSEDEIQVKFLCVLPDMNDAIWRVTVTIRPHGNGPRVQIKSYPTGFKVMAGRIERAGARDWGSER